MRKPGWRVSPRRGLDGAAHPQTVGPQPTRERRSRPGACPRSVGRVLGAAGCAVLVLVVAVAGPYVAAIAFAAGAIVALVTCHPLAGVCLAIAAIPLGASGLAVGASAGLSASEGLFLLTAAGVVGRVVLTSERFPLPLPHIAFGAFVAVAALGVLFAADRFVIAKTAGFWGVMLVASLVVARASRRELTAVLASIAFAGGMVGLVAILNAGDLELRAGGEFVNHRAETAFGQPNILAFFLILAIPVAIAMGLRGPRSLRAGMLLLGALAIGGLALTFSRSGLLAAMLALGVLSLWRPFRIPLAGLAAAAVIAIALMPGGIGSNLIGQRLSTLTEGQHVQENPRQSVWRLAPQVIAERPVLGVGLSNFGGASARHGVVTSFKPDRSDPEPFPHAHNLLLNVAAETGIVGLSAFLAFVLATAQAAIRAWRRTTAREKPFVIGLIAALVGFLSMGVADYQFTAPHAVIGTLMVEISALVAYTRIAAASDRPSLG